ncbi:MAG: hypothetical protein IT449_01270 [Phycisphaerales bacterium]|nr:hypothetical protein [Phycisphaerales bacterium]
MKALLSREAALDRFFLEMRSRVLDVAAALDRVDAAAPQRLDGGADDARLTQLRESLRILLECGHDRAERVLLVFSDAYDPAWRTAISAA